MTLRIERLRAAKQVAAFIEANGLSTFNSPTGRCLPVRGADAGSARLQRPG